jgi:hypothetical protein
MSPNAGALRLDFLEADLNCGIGSSFLNALVKDWRGSTWSVPRIPDIQAEIEPMDFRQQASWGVEGSVDERVVEDQLCALVGDLGFPPQLQLTLQWFVAFGSKGHRIIQCGPTMITGLV